VCHLDRGIVGNNNRIASRPSAFAALSRPQLQDCSLPNIALSHCEGTSSMLLPSTDYGELFWHHADMSYRRLPSYLLEDWQVLPFLQDSWWEEDSVVVMNAETIAEQNINSFYDLPSLAQPSHPTKCEGSTSLSPPLPKYASTTTSTWPKHGSNNLSLLTAAPIPSWRYLPVSSNTLSSTATPNLTPSPIYIPELAGCSTTQPVLRYPRPCLWRISPNYRQLVDDTHALSFWSRYKAAEVAELAALDELDAVPASIESLESGQADVTAAPKIRDIELPSLQSLRLSTADAPAPPRRGLVSKQLPVQLGRCFYPPPPPMSNPETEQTMLGLGLLLGDHSDDTSSDVIAGAGNSTGRQVLDKLAPPPSYSEPGAASLARATAFGTNQLSASDVNAREPKADTGRTMLQTQTSPEVVRQPSTFVGAEPRGTIANKVSGSQSVSTRGAAQLQKGRKARNDGAPAR
jgi:hypothetical protein